MPQAWLDKRLWPLQREIKGIVIFHQKFPTSHYPKTRTNFIPELPLDIIKSLWEDLGRFYKTGKNIRDDFFSCGAIEHFSFMAVLSCEAFPCHNHDSDRSLPIAQQVGWWALGLQDFRLDPVLPAQFGQFS